MLFRHLRPQLNSLTRYIALGRDLRYVTFKKLSKLALIFCHDVMVGQNNLPRKLACKINLGYSLIHIPALRDRRMG